MFGCLNPDESDEIDETFAPRGMSAAILPVKAPFSDCNSEKGSWKASVEMNVASNEVELYLKPK